MLNVTFMDFVVGANGILLMIVGYFLKDAMDEIKLLREKHANLHEHYVKKDDFKDFKDELWKRLDELRKDLKSV